jgi:hypothetical protein
MKTETLSEADLEKADAQAVMDQLIAGKPLDPEIERRVRERAQKITDEVRRTHGLIDDATIDALLHDDEDL